MFSAAIMAISFIISIFVALVLWAGFAYLLLGQILIIPTINIRHAIFNSAWFRAFFATQFEALNEEFRQFRLLHGLMDDSGASGWDSTDEEMEDEESDWDWETAEMDVEDEVQERYLLALESEVEVRVGWDGQKEVIVVLRDGWEEVVSDEGAQGFWRLVRASHGVVLGEGRERRVGLCLV